MIEMLEKLFLEISSIFMSILLTIGTTFGAFVDPTTTEAVNYHDSNIKNVIFLIGDGMGFNHLEKTKDEKEVDLAMDTFLIRGDSMTRSLTNKVTDSAAGGTALATGVRTYNGAIGVYLTDSLDVVSHPKNITELCLEKGMMTGVITSDETSGATPSAFSAHESNRDKAEGITEDQLASGIHLIWGAQNGIATKEAAKSNGYSFVTTYDEMMALEEGSKSFAQFTNDLWTLEQSDENTPTLEQMTVKAIDLLDDTDEGFFLMIEGAHIDKHSHSNEDENMMEAVMEFDKVIDYVLEYAAQDGETLVIVTADHETGAITKESDGYVFTSGSHSSANVPLLIYGSDKLIENGETVNNYEIPIRIAYVLGFNEEQFPVSVKK